MDRLPEPLHGQNEGAKALTGGAEAAVGLRPSAARDAEVTAGPISLDPVSRTATLGRQPLYLTQTEFELLSRFMQRPRWIWSREQLLEEIWGYQFADPRVVTVHVGNLRRKLARAEEEAAGPAPSCPERDASTGRDVLHASPATRAVARRAHIETVRGIGYRLAVPRYRDASQPVGRPGEHQSGAGLDALRAGAPAALDRTPFVGREREMTELQASLSAMLAGQIRSVGIAGDAGIGKTRLAEEFAAYAQQCGVEVAWGSCHEGSLRIPYEPWVQILDSWGRDTTRAVLGQDLEEDPPKTPGSSREAQRDRLLLLERLAAVARRRATGHPLCLIIEDLHWADVSTLLAFQYAFRHIRGVPLMLVTTYRPGEGPVHPAASSLLKQLLAEVVRASGGLILSLGSLSETEVREFVCSFGADQTLPHVGRLGDEAYRQSEGNPFYLTQFMRLLSLRPAETRPGSADLHLGRQEGIRNVVLHRVSSLSAECRRWLDAASVCGREFVGSVAAEVGALAPELLPRVLTEAATIRLIGLDEDRPEVCRFAHSLIRDVLYGELSPVTLASLHARAGTVLERHHGGDGGRHVAELAHHYCCALSLGYTEKAFDLCVQAGDLAARQYAWEEACHHYQRALDIEPLLSPDSDGRMVSAACKAYEDMGDTYALAGAFDKSVEAYENAASRLPREERISNARLKRKQMLPFQRRGKYDLALSAVTQARSLLGPPVEGAGSTWWQEWIEVELDRAFLHYQSGEVEEANALIESVQAPIEAHGTDGQRTKLVVTTWLVDLRRRRYVATTETLRIAEDLARQAIARASLFDLEDAEMVLGTTLYFYPHGTKEREAAHARLLRYRELAKQTNDHVFQIDAAGMLSTWHRLHGDVEEARRYAIEVLSLAADGQVVKYRAEARGNLAWAAWRLGDEAGAKTEATTGLDDLQSRSPRSPFEWTVRWPLLALSSRDGDLRGAAAQAVAMLDPLQQKMPDDLEELAERFVKQQEMGLSDTFPTLERLMALAHSYGYL